MTESTAKFTNLLLPGLFMKRLGAHPVRLKLIMGLTIIVLWVLIIITAILRFPISDLPGTGNSAIVVETDSLSAKKQIANLEKEITGLQKKLDNYTPAGAYLVVNTHNNDFRLYKRRELIREGKCSTGSYIMLQKGDQEKWMFKTPKGMFRILGKTVAPVWKKPDWAFVEEGLPIPPVNHPSRYEYGVLGDYSLSLGQGYLLHGTLYKRLLGMPVTHGCIRLNDEDLEAIFRNLSVGSKVYIY